MDITKPLSKSLLLSSNQFQKYIRTVPFRYKRYNIKKRSGSGFREIAQPTKAVKRIQTQSVEILAKNLPIHPCAYAYQKGRGIKENALIHSKNRYLLKLDFKDFFNSIVPEIFFNIVKKHNLNLSDDDKTTLENLLFYRRHRKSPLTLSIGAPSSPFVSNAIMYFFDKEISNSCYQINVRYTRYADDLTFSTNKKGVLPILPKLIEKVLTTHFNGKIKINNDKTVLSSKAFNRHVTGVTINNNGNLSLGRNRKRVISSMIHKFKHNSLSMEDSLKLHGLLGHALYIEPEFISRMDKKYGHDTIKKINCIKK